MEKDKTPMILLIKQQRTKKTAIVGAHRHSSMVASREGGGRLKRVKGVK